MGYDTNLIREMIKADKHCHDDLLCYCAVRSKLDSLRAALGSENLELLLEYICDSCAVPTQPATPGGGQQGALQPKPIDPAPAKPLTGCVVYAPEVLDAAEIP